MALDRLLPVSTTPGAITGDSYMDAVQEEVTGLWDRSVITLTAVAGTNTITATVTPALTAGLVNGMLFVLVPANTTTGAVTLNGNPVVDGEGGALTAANPLRISGNYLLRWDSGLTKYVVIGFFPAAVVQYGSKLLKTQAASASSSIDFVNGVSGVVFDDTYDAYRVVISNAKPATDDVELWMRIGTGGGPTYQVVNYQYASSQLTANAVANTVTSTSATRIIIAGTTTATRAVGNAAGENVSGTVEMHNPETTDFFQVYFQMAYNEAAGGDTTNVTGSGRYTSGTAITAIRFMFESGNIASGRFSLYGITKA
jgi:hypothetical protein